MPILLMSSKISFSHTYFKIAVSEMTLPKSLFLVNFEVNRKVLPITLTLVSFFFWYYIHTFFLNNVLDILPRTISFVSYSVLNRTNWNSYNVPFTIQSCLSHDTHVILKIIFVSWCWESLIFLSWVFFISIWYLMQHNLVRGSWHSMCSGAAGSFSGHYCTGADHEIQILLMWYLK